MSRIVHVNGSELPEDQAVVSVFDRGFLMADAVYEVTAVLDGKLLDFPGHLARLGRSLGELGITNPHDDATWLDLHRRMVAANGIGDGLIYLQVTRGNPGDRDFVWAEGVAPTVVMFTQAKPGLADAPQAQTGQRIVTVEDLRWGRRDIKTVQLLFPSMAKMEARARDADDAWLVEDGLVTEGTSNNAWIVKDGRIITRQLSHDILHGITRAAVMRLAAEAQMTVEERGFSPAEAIAADEAFVTSASAFVMPVVEVDGNAIGNGTPGPLSRRLREIYVADARASAL